MGKWIRFLILALVLGVSTPAVSQFQPQGDMFPWPWGAECPFPWDTMDGYWEVDFNEAGDFHSYLEFKVIAELQDGKRYFELRQFDQNQQLIALGRAASPKGQRIVRAVLITRPTKQGTRSAYMAVIRAYDARDKRLYNEPFSCQQNDLVRVVTFWNDDSPGSEDAHMFMRKVSDPTLRERLRRGSY